MGALLFSAILVVGACSGSAATTAPTAAPTAAATAAATAAPSAAGSAATGAKPFAGRTLHIAVDAFRKDWDTALWSDLFEQETGAKIEWTYVPFEGLDAKYASIIASKDKSYDLITAIVTTAPAYRDSLFVPLNGLVDDAILKDLTALDKVGDKVWSYAIFNDGFLWYWNKDMWKAAGLDPEKPPTSYDELFAQCEQIKQKLKKPCYDWQLPDPNTSFFYWALTLNGAGGKMYNDDQTKIAFNGPEGLAAMKVFAQTTKYADPAGYAMKSQDEPALAFAQEQVAGNFNWDFEDTAIISNPAKSKIVGKTGISIMPGIGGVRSGSSNGWEGYGINVNSDNKDLAAAWVTFTLRKDNQLLFYKKLGFQSSRRSLLSDPDFAGNRGTPVLKEQFNYSVERFGFGASSAVNEIFDVVLHKVKDGSMTPEAAIAELATKVQAKMDEYNATAP